MFPPFKGAPFPVQAAVMLTDAVEQSLRDTEKVLREAYSELSRLAPESVQPEVGQLCDGLYDSHIRALCACAYAYAQLGKAGLLAEAFSAHRIAYGLRVVPDEGIPPGELWLRRGSDE